MSLKQPSTIQNSNPQNSRVIDLKGNTCQEAYAFSRKCSNDTFGMECDKRFNL